MACLEVTVTYQLNDEQVKKLEDILTWYHDYKGDKNDFPFKNWTIADLFESLMFTGSDYDINDRITWELQRQGKLSR